MWTHDCGGYSAATSSPSSQGHRQIPCKRNLGILSSPENTGARVAGHALSEETVGVCKCLPRLKTLTTGAEQERNVGLPMKNGLLVVWSQE